MVEYKLILCITPDALQINAKAIAPWLRKIEKATDGQITAKATATRFVTGVWQAWIATGDGKSVGLYATEVVKDDGGRMICTTRFVTGNDYAEWQHLYGQIEEWAKEGKCHKMAHTGRKGLSRGVLKDYSVTHWLYEKEL